MIAFTTTLGYFILAALEVIGGLAALTLAGLIAIYVVVWGAVFISALLKRTR